LSGKLFAAGLSLPAVICAALLTAQAGEADWLYQAAGFIDRFDSIGASRAAPRRKQMEYFTLFDNVRKFAKADRIPDRERRCREALRLFMEAMIYEQLGDAAASKRAEEGYDRLKQDLPENDRTLMENLFRRPRGKKVLHVPRFCEVESRGKEVRVSAADYPIRAVLEKIAAAAGERIEIPENVTGFVDWSDTRWRKAGLELAVLGLPNGLMCGRGPGGRGFRIVVTDRHYDLSVGERSDKRPPRPNPTVEQEGIKKGFLIYRGHYVRPPYAVRADLKENRVELSVNGLPLQTIRLPKEAGNTHPPARTHRKRFETRKDLTLHVFGEYARVGRERGLDAALAAVAAILEANKHLVKSYELSREYQSLRIRDHAGRTHTLFLTSAWVPGETESQRRRAAEDVRQRHIRRVENKKKQIMQTLASGGLVVVGGSGQRTYLYDAREAKRLLSLMVYTLDEIARLKANLASSLFDEIEQNSSDMAWEILLNLRHRELIKAAAPFPAAR